MRRLIVLITTMAGLCIAGLAQGAAGQERGPTISVSPSSDTAGNSGTWSLVVRGSNFSSTSRVVIAFAGTTMGAATPTTGSFTITIAPARRAAGNYAIEATQDPCSNQFTRGPCPFTVATTFRSVPISSFNNPCGTSGDSVTLTVSGSFFPPESYGYVIYDLEGPDQKSQSRIPTGSGSFTASFSVVVPNNRTITIRVYDVDQNQAPDLTWRPGPCLTTTAPTSTSTSTTNTTLPSRMPGSDATTTITVVDLPGPDVTLPPNVELPPETPGATLTVSPALGPPGFVTGAVGTGFPPGPVELRWEPGIGGATVVAGPDGTFTVRILVLPNDRIGPRALLATGGGTTALDKFLVVPSTVQPSASDVTEITRIRRFLQR